MTLHINEIIRVTHGTHKGRSGLVWALGSIEERDDGKAEQRQQALVLFTSAGEADWVYERNLEAEK